MSAAARRIALVVVLKRRYCPGEVKFPLGTYSPRLGLVHLQGNE